MWDFRGDKYVKFALWGNHPNPFYRGKFLDLDISRILS